MATKQFKFINGAAKRAFLALPDAVKTQFSTDLQAVRDGKKSFSPSKDISSSIGAGAIELIENGSPAYRAVYCAKHLDTVYILHAFTKTCEGVDQAAMKTAKKRHKDMMEEVADAKKAAKKQGKQGKQAKPKTKKR